MQRRKVQGHMSEPSLNNAHNQFKINLFFYEKNSSVFFNTLDST